MVRKLKNVLNQFEKENQKMMQQSWKMFYVDWSIKLLIVQQHEIDNEVERIQKMRLKIMLMLNNRKQALLVVEVVFDEVVDRVMAISSNKV